MGADGWPCVYIHSNESVIDRHYTAKIEVAKKSINFRVFREAEDGVN